MRANNSPPKSGPNTQPSPIYAPKVVPERASSCPLVISVSTAKQVVLPLTVVNAPHSTLSSAIVAIDGWIATRDLRRTLESGPTSRLRLRPYLSLRRPIIGFTRNSVAPTAPAQNADNELILFELPFNSLCNKTTQAKVILWNIMTYNSLQTTNKHFHYSLRFWPFTTGYNHPQTTLGDITILTKTSRKSHRNMDKNMSNGSIFDKEIPTWTSANNHQVHTDVEQSIYAEN